MTVAMVPRDQLTAATAANLMLRDELARVEEERDRLAEAVVAVHHATPNYGANGCSCGNQGTPWRKCDVHWAIWILERHNLDFDGSGARAALAPFRKDGQ